MYVLTEGFLKKKKKRERSNCCCTSHLEGFYDHFQTEWSLSVRKSTQKSSLVLRNHTQKTLKRYLRCYRSLRMLNVATLHLKKPQESWNNWRCLVRSHCATTGENQTHLTTSATTVKRSGGSVKIWICLAGLCSTLQSFTWPWTPLYTKVFKSQVKPSLQNWVMQQNSDPKQSSIAMVGL